MRSLRLSLVERVAVLAAISLAALGIAGCGGDNNDSGTSSNSGSTSSSGSTSTQPAAGKGTKGVTTLKLQADPSGAFSFDKKSLEATAGKVTIDMKNPSPVQHDVAIEGNGVEKKGPTVSDGGTSTVTADLKAGKYTFYCSVDGHKQAGMEGTLTVK